MKKNKKENVTVLTVYPRWHVLSVCPKDSYEDFIKNGRIKMNHDWKN